MDIESCSLLRYDFNLGLAVNDRFKTFLLHRSQDSESVKLGKCLL